MQVITDIHSLSEDAKGCSLAIGNFDGLHLGHQAILNEARMDAQKKDRRVALLTFEPHPRSYFRPESEPFRLTTLRDKIRFLDHMAWDLVFALPFDQQMAKTGAAEFVLHLLKRSIETPSVFVGQDFHFGAERSGSSAVLQELGAKIGIQATIIPQLRDSKDVPFSSTFIRESLKAGDLASAQRQMGRPWSIEGVVTKGDQRGREMGFPTANLSLGSYLRPALGVYAFWTEIEGEKRIGAANIGIRPSVEGTEVRLEAHLFDFDGDLYGQSLVINLVDFLRPERKFSSLFELRTQIEKDCVKAREILQDWI